LTEQSIEIINILKDLGNQIRSEMLNNIDIEELNITCKVLNLININLKN
jgi:hypothetical protein